MEGIEKITARIIEDAEREIAQMQRENEEKINALTAEAKSAAEQESLELLTRGRRAAEVSIPHAGGTDSRKGTRRQKSYFPHTNNRIERK